MLLSYTYDDAPRPPRHSVCSNNKETCCIVSQQLPTISKCQCQGKKYTNTGAQIAKSCWFIGRISDTFVACTNLAPLRKASFCRCTILRDSSASHESWSHGSSHEISSQDIFSSSWFFWLAHSCHSVWLCFSFFGSGEVIRQRAHIIKCNCTLCIHPQILDWIDCAKSVWFAANGAIISWIAVASSFELTLAKNWQVGVHLDRNAYIKLFHVQISNHLGYEVS